MAKGKLSIGVKASIAGVLLSVCFFTVEIAATLVPTRLAPLSTEFPAIEDRSGRVPKKGCALTEAKTDAGCRAVTVKGVREEQITFPSRIPEKGLDRLAGTLSLPDTDDPRRPAVLLIGGSGPTSRDGTSAGDLVHHLSRPLPLLKELADHLAKQGMVVLRFDKRVPRYYPNAKLTSHLFRFSDNVDDAKDALAYLASRSDVDPQALVVAGHSEGGHFAPLVAKGQGGVRAVMLLAGTTQSFETGLMSQLDRFVEIRHRQLDFLGPLNIFIQRRAYATCFEHLTGASFVPTEVCIGGGVTQQALKDYEVMSRDVPELLRNGPYAVLALQGSVDRNIDPVEIPRIKKLREGKDTELHYVEGVSHPLANIRDDAPKVDASVLTRLSTFVASVGREAR